MTEHPITPPPTELVEQWADEFYSAPIAQGDALLDIATRAAQWGADQELEACCELLNDFNTYHLVELLRAARTRKPPSLKKQALDELHISFDRGYLKEGAADIIRRALEQLDD